MPSTVNFEIRRPCRAVSRNSQNSTAGIALHRAMNTGLQKRHFFGLALKGLSAFSAISAKPASPITLDRGPSVSSPRNIEGDRRHRHDTCNNPRAEETRRISRRWWPIREISRHAHRQFGGKTAIAVQGKSDMSVGPDLGEQRSLISNHGHRSLRSDPVADIALSADRCPAPDLRFDPATPDKHRVNGRFCFSSRCWSSVDDELFAIGLFLDQPLGDFP